MADETNVTSVTTEAVKKTSDGMVKITLEKYNELVDKTTSQQIELERTRARLQKAIEEPPVINRTNVIKTPEMLAEEQRVSGITLMGVGVSFFLVGAYRYTIGNKS